MFAARRERRVASPLLCGKATAAIAEDAENTLSTKVQISASSALVFPWTGRMAMARIESRSRLPFYRRIAWTALLMLLSTAAPVVAQFDPGTLSGTIKDEQGAVMHGVTVTAHNTQTQQGDTTVTDATGFYTFPNLLPGRYDILAELQGFKTIRRENVQLDATANLTLDLAMPTGVIAEEVLVTASSPLLQTDVALRKTIEAKDIEQL